MRNCLSLILALCLASAAKAQLSFDEPAQPRSIERRLQGSIAVGWRADHHELAKAPVFDLGLSLRFKQPFSLVGRLSLQPEQNSYFVTNLSMGSVAMGVRAQSPGRILNMYGALEIDHSWWIGQTVLYSYDSGKILSRVSSRVSKTGLALSFGVAAKVASRLGIDLGVRRVFNSSHRVYDVVTIPPVVGDAVWEFPRDLYNQTVVFLQSRVGIF